MLKDEQEELDSRSPEAEAIVPAVTPADLLNVGDVLLAHVRGNGLSGILIQIDKTGGPHHICRTFRIPAVVLFRFRFFTGSIKQIAYLTYSLFLLPYLI